MAICDVCSVELTKDKKRISSTQMKKAVEAGFRPPKDEIDDLAVKKFGDQGPKLLQAGWLERAMKDDSDWLLCMKCATDMEKMLKKEKKENITGKCTKCGRKVNLLEIANGHVPALRKDDIIKLGFYCKSCKKVFCGACCLPSLLSGGTGIPTLLPECPECYERVDFASPSQA